MKRSSGVRIAAAVMSLALAAAGSTATWSQQPAANAYPPGPDFTGVAGSVAERERIAALCGPNRNAQDGYAPPPAFPGQTRAPIVEGDQGYAVETVARIDRPWGAAFLPSGKLLVSFRDGGMRIVGMDGTVSVPLAGAPQIVQPRLGSGMYDVILDRDFARNRTIYFTFHTRQPGDAAAMGRVGAARLSADERSLEDVRILREGVDIQPRRLVQANDGKLLVLSAGVADQGTDHQDLASQFGKVLRINTDGSIPPDNPFVNTPNANPAVWALGYRDIHSAVIHPQTGELWVAENTPRGGDELNIMRAGRNYGFMVISYGRRNNGELINGGKTAQEGMEQPLYYWNPSFAPSGMMIYTGERFPQWRGDVFIGGMSGMQLVRLEMQGERVVAEEKLLMDRCQRIKTVLQGPDGNIYVLTDQNPPAQNEIFRLVPAATVPARRMPGAPAPAAPAPSASALPAASAEELALGAGVYVRSCGGCHGPEGRGGAIGPAIAGRTDTGAVIAIIRDGASPMPAFGSRLSAAEIEAVAKHLSRLPM